MRAQVPALLAHAAGTWRLTAQCSEDTCCDVKIAFVAGRFGELRACLCLAWQARGSVLHL